MASRRPPRLPHAAYVGANGYSVTIRAVRGSSPFVQTPCVERVLLQLQRTAATHHVAVLAFCFMPDHLHLVLEALDKEADLVKFVSRFKQYAGFEQRRETGNRLWQEGFYDRVLREDEATEDTVRYVLANPVRAGLVTAIHEWPFSGSDVFDIRHVTP